MLCYISIRAIDIYPISEYNPFRPISDEREISMKFKHTWLSEYNGLFKANDKMYRDAVKSFGISESTFWILYTIRNAPDGITQREIIRCCFLPPQTINSALKKMEANGYVELRTGTDRRTKQVYLTEKGKALSAKSVDCLIAIEVQASEQLTQEEKTEFLHIFDKYISTVQSMLNAAEPGDMK